jgi:hypothetical protein
LEAQPLTCGQGADVRATSVQYVSSDVQQAPAVAFLDFGISCGDISAHSANAAAGLAFDLITSLTDYLPRPAA